MTGHTSRKTISFIVVLSMVMGMFAPMMAAAVEIPENQKCIRLDYNGQLISISYPPLWNGTRIEESEMNKAYDPEQIVPTLSFNMQRAQPFTIGIYEVKAGESITELYKLDANNTPDYRCWATTGSRYSWILS